MNKIVSSSVFAFASLFLPSIASAGDYSEQFEKCMESAGSTQAMRECIADEIAVYDKKLNRYYKVILDNLKEEPNVATNLKKAQIAWLKYTSANSSFYSSNQGSMYSIETDMAYLKAISLRVDEMYYILNLYDCLDQIED